MSLVKVHSFFTEFDIELFKAGKHFKLYEKMGAHPMVLDGEEGVYFAVWAPSASSVQVIGDFNFWDASQHELNVRWDASGIWEGFIPKVKKGTRYKYKITSNHNGSVSEKIDPYALFFETPPNTAGIIWDISDYKWKDKNWMSYRKDKNDLDKPYSVYEVHIGSWQRNSDGTFLSYTELAKKLVAYVKEMNFTHIEFMPVMEYPYDPSWGYQLVGYFAPSSRFGAPQDFMKLIDAFHQNDIGVILDWVPSHFPEDKHGLGMYDGTHLYEHPDPKKGFHPDWKSLIFNYERNEVRSFLISNAFFWLEYYHVDALRVDAVASMLYLDYSREEGEWDPNEFGGNENLAAVSFLKDFNTAVYSNFNGIQTIAEESTAFSGVTRSVELGGLGFGMKWMMGWMHDTLQYFSKDPVYRKHHQNDITFSLTYAFTENFMLPLSHDEVVHGKNSILSKQSGDEWQRFANLRLLYGYMFTHPGTKLLFMGGEFGQYAEWDFSKSLDWNLLDFLPHKGMLEFVKNLNTFYKSTPALYEKAFSPEGFEWISYSDEQNSVIAYIRKGHDRKNDVIVVCNFTPSLHQNYRLGVPRQGVLTEIFNSDQNQFGGAGNMNTGDLKIENIDSHGKTQSVVLTLPPLAMAAFQIK
ncbi:1,4-alpha-glucan branching protein GlgB [Ulvibacter antarcticus]|uniref:1,4-alpha-glucan branching enzyme GlgB n=1 Tax=Ulvibacter antarcticus TaxID=442714 RepID=A0A3L9YS20_9FLAO|nr:1,4-alpha-glucan branching protein GlgB [Ulvibacter antarcticus]RMA57302.1 1,4-alpha-glucan branching enzyme [Ulvibacter antarcticus]